MISLVFNAELADDEVSLLTDRAAEEDPLPRPGSVALSVLDEPGFLVVLSSDSASKRNWA